MAHDEYFFFIASVIGLIFYDDAVLANYHQHDSNVSGPKIRKSLVDQLRYKFNLRTEDYQRYVDNSAKRARILDLLASDTSLEWMERQAAHDSSMRYRHLGLIQKRRLEIYNSASLSQRVSALSDLIRTGQYGVSPDPWRFTIAGLAKDALAVIAPLRSPAE
jgi:hypothetical protein